MLCRNPYMADGSPHGCGRCPCCKVNNKRVWTNRIMFEASHHLQNSWYTLTYNDAHLPEDGGLVKKDAQDWTKRMRKAVSPTVFRFFTVGEYGDKTNRPHYHVCLFGLGLDYAETVRLTWRLKGSPLGNVQAYDLDNGLAEYTSGYHVKKMTKPDDPRLGGLPPEFTLSSRRAGGIGAPAIMDIAQQLLPYIDDYMREHGDVPVSIQRGGKSWPLGRYMRSKLREIYGYGTKATAQALANQEAELSTVLSSTPLSPAVQAELAALSHVQSVRMNGTYENIRRKIILREAYRQKILNAETRLNIYASQHKGTF